jgi:hypothetical protein
MSGSQPEKIASPIPHVVVDSLIAFLNEQALQVRGSGEASELRMAAVALKTAKRTGARVFVSF